MRRLALPLLQLGALVVLNHAGYAVAEALALPLPGNLVGMLLLVGAFSSGLVRVEWLRPGAPLLTRHLAFFFIPMTVGLMGFADLFAEAGFRIVATLVLSAAVGICAAGLTSQALARRQGGAP